MEDGFPIFGGKPTVAVVHHHAPQRMYPKPLAEISVVALAVDAVPTLPIKDWNYMVTFPHVHNTLSHTLNNSAPHQQATATSHKSTGNFC